MSCHFRCKRERPCLNTMKRQERLVKGKQNTMRSMTLDYPSCSGRIVDCNHVAFNVRKVCRIAVNYPEIAGTPLRRSLAGPTSPCDKSLR